MVGETPVLAVQSGGPTLLDGVMRTLHLLVAAVWVGSVVFVTVGVLPLGRDGTADAEPLERIVGRLTTVSRISSVVLLLTGGHMAAKGYTFGSLTSTTNGYLVLAMVALWLALTALVEVGASRMRDPLQRKKVRSPVRDNGVFFKAASVVGVLLLVDAGIITTGLLV